MESGSTRVAERSRVLRLSSPGLLERVQVELRVTLEKSGGLGEVAAPMVLSANAKRARTRIVELVGRSVAADLFDLVDIAVAVELIHAASLLHDDVIDGASERRGLPTANAVSGPKLAILAGDMLLALALARLRPIGPQAVDLATDVVAEMASGVAREFMARGRLDLGLPAWREIAEAKTGALFGLSARLVAARARMDDAALSLDRALRRLGVAFQIADDAADYLGASGETPLQDLRDGVPNLPALVAAERVPGLRSELEAIVTASALGRLAPLALESAASKILRSGAVDIALSEVRNEIECARSEVSHLSWHRETNHGIAQVFEWAEALATDLESRLARFFGDPASREFHRR